jgi:hypothetical protein
LRAKLLAAYRNEALLRAGSALTPQVWHYLETATALDPDAT